MAAHYFPLLYGATIHPKLGFTIVMEYCSLGDLRTYISTNNSSISWSERRSIMHEISIAISMAHEQHIIHCDLHTGNILRANHQDTVRVKVTDFGLSRILGSSFYIRNGTYGVLPYMAPELIQGAVYSKATDIYALGMIMWELSAGTPPFTGYNDDAYLTLRICEGVRPPSLEGTPTCWVELMTKCWHPNPDSRPSADDICDEIEAWSECSRTPWNPNVDTTRSVFQYNAANLNAVEQFKVAEEHRKQNPPPVWEQRGLYTSNLVPRISKTSSKAKQTKDTEKNVIDNDEWDEMVRR